MLKITNISKSFKDKKILQSLSFEAEAGSINVFLGTSGTGKSTILRALNKLETIESGTILFNSKPLKQSDIGMVFQDFNLFPHLTIEENITLPLMHVFKKTELESKAIAQNLLKQYFLEDFAHAYPGSLSGGQKQRVALARTLATNPKIICLDEPTSALDPVLTSMVAEIITQLAQQQLTIIVATHDSDLIKRLNCTMYLMDKGKIKDVATTQELATHSEKHSHLKNFLDI